MRIVVIGAGVVGVHVSVTLAGRGAEVTLVERGLPGEGTTAGSFAWIDASHPGLAEYAELRVRGLEAWRRAREAWGNPRWVPLAGTLWWTDDEEELQALDAHAERLDELGFGPERLSVADAVRHEPDLLMPPSVDLVYRFANEGYLLAAPAIEALLARGAQAGMTLRANSEVASFIIDQSDAVVGVTLASGESLAADVVVSCVGRWTQRLLGRAGLDVPIIDPEEPRSPARGLVVCTAPTGARINGVLMAGGMLMRRDAAGGLLLHSDAHDLRPAEESVAHEVVALAAERVRGADDARVQDFRLCYRAIPGDLLPVVGWAADGLYAIVTHSGVSLSAALGEIAAVEVIDGRDLHELSRFRPARFRHSLV